MVEGANDTAVPIRRRVVRAAAIVAIMCTEGQTEKPEKWCSASHTASYPLSSMISKRSIALA